MNHVIDPTFFYDAIEEFSFDYTLYNLTGKSLDEHGQSVLTYATKTVRGSLQSQGKNLRQDKKGNTTEWAYKFYCKSLYQVDIGDIISYKNNYLRITGIRDYDEYGVREADLEMIKLSAYRDLAAYIKYTEGQEIV